jgi:hypothetical protein
MYDFCSHTQSQHRINQEKPQKKKNNNKQKRRKRRGDKAPSLSLQHFCLFSVWFKAGSLKLAHMTTALPHSHPACSIAAITLDAMMFRCALPGLAMTILAVTAPTSSEPYYHRWHRLWLRAMFIPAFIHDSVGNPYCMASWVQPAVAHY